MTMNSDALQFTGSTFLIVNGVFWVYSLGLLFLEVKYPNLLKPYRVQPDADPTDRTDPSRILEVFSRVAFNQFIVSPLMAYLFFFVYSWFWGQSILEVGDRSTFQMLLDIMGCIFVEEVLFYYSHRMFHHRLLYRYHKIHHEWTSPIGLTATYSHWLEHVFSNLLPVMVGPILFQCNVSTLYIWITLAILSTVNSHSGFHFPLVVSPEYHDFHHLHFNQNYGVLGLLDYLHGTDVLFRRSPQYRRHISFFLKHPPPLENTYPFEIASPPTDHSDDSE